MKKIFLPFLLFASLNAFSQHEAFKVDVFGSGQPVILISGPATSDDMWNPVIEKLKTTYQFHVITIAGLAGVPPIDTPILKTVKNELISYVKENNLNNPVLIGQGIGALLSLWAAGEEPLLFSKILVTDNLPFKSPTIVSSNYSADIAENPSYKIAAEATKLKKIPGEGFEATMNKTLLKYISDPVEVSSISKRINESDQKTLGFIFSEVRKINLAKNLAKIDNPVLIIGSMDGSKESSKKHLEAQYKLLPQKSIIIAPARHFIIYNNPLWFREQVKNFLVNGLSS